MNQLEYYLGSTISYNDAPTICRLKFSKGGNWAYSTNGHFMNASGYSIPDSSTSSLDMVYVTDPNITRVDTSSNGRYWITLSELYTATANHFAHEFAY